MKVIYAREEIPRVFSKSIFLAGPSPRSKDVKSWRPEALKELKSLGYDGVVFIPESRDGSYFDYDEQIMWEHDAIGSSDCVLFWIPRDLEVLPGFTTNDDGQHLSRGPQKTQGKLYLDVLIMLQKQDIKKHMLIC